MYFHSGTSANETFVGIAADTVVTNISATADNKVGIATTTPTETLDVNGNTKINGFVQLDTTVGSPNIACSDSSHYGRMVVDPTATPAALWICGSAGWVSK
ncbi:MAG: hypothetical protein KC646_12965 [Candidatus Cloacimonetes bacterium]|nr:hypothetical protein [Candidatus Cloacimonadota bacterium]